MKPLVHTAIGATSVRTEGTTKLHAIDFFISAHYLRIYILSFIRFHVTVLSRFPYSPSKHPAERSFIELRQADREKKTEEKHFFE